jgi:SAM-dependent methyltransferase/uncharacterized protein YbaR (Trm112 family)
MPVLRRWVKRIPGVDYCYGQYRLRQYGRACGPEFSRLLHAAPRGVPPLHLANSLKQFEWVVRHPMFPPDLFERLMPPGPGRTMDRAFANFTLGYLDGQKIATEWHSAEPISEGAERRLTEFLNQYITDTMWTFTGYLDMRADPECTDAIRLRRVLGELEGEQGELLDVGCAFVMLAERYAQMRRWIGVDLSLPAMAIGRIIHRVSPDSLVCAYSEHLPFADEAFDVVVSSEVLEHTPRPDRMVAEIARVLRDGGKAVVSVPMHVVDYQDGRQHLIGPTAATHRVHFHSLDGLQSLFQQHGLAVERLQANPHYIFTLRRDPRDGAKEGRRGEGNREAIPVACPNPPSSCPSDFACPDCRGALQAAAAGLSCTACDSLFARHDGIPVLLPRRLRGLRLELAA